MYYGPIELTVAAFPTQGGAAKAMNELKQANQEGLIGIGDMAIVVKDAEGKTKITDAKHRTAKGLLTGGVIGSGQRASNWWNARPMRRESSFMRQRFLILGVDAFKDRAITMKFRIKNHGVRIPVAERIVAIRGDAPDADKRVA